MEIVNRKDIDVEDYQEIFKAEAHHDHPVVRDEHGTLRWEGDPKVREIINKGILNDLVYLFYKMGLTKNSEEVRKLYRDMGYSLSGYWEIFYWEVNNPEAADYNPHTDKYK